MKYVPVLADRVARVSVPAARGQSIGTAFPVAQPDGAAAGPCRTWLLTARHVVYPKDEPPGQPATIWLDFPSAVALDLQPTPPATERRFPATVVMDGAERSEGTLDPSDDWLLLEATLPPVVEPFPWGILDATEVDRGMGEQRPVRYNGAGYPTGAQNRFHPVSGKVTAATGAGTSAFLMVAVDADVGSNVNPTGFSGGPVLVEGVAVALFARSTTLASGVVGHAEVAGTRRARPLESIIKPRVAALHPPLATPRPPVDPVLDAGAWDLPQQPPPSMLLDARYRVVDFQGRTELLEDLRGWSESEGSVLVRLVIGPGGMGKTRLAIELCRKMREEKGWRAGFVPEGDGLGELLESDRPVLAVIDYAESRPHLGTWLRLAAGRAGRTPLRLLLLARNADAWWADVVGADAAVKRLAGALVPLELFPLTGAREAVFQEAVKAFARAQGKAAPTGLAPGLTDRRYGRVLYVHAAALATVEGRAVEPERLLGDALDHEERFWRKQLPGRASVDDMRRVTAALTLKGGASSWTEVQALIERIAGAPDKNMALLVRDLYSGRTPKYVGGLEPDLLGEVLVERALHREGAGAGDYLDRIFQGADAQTIRTGFTVLGRLSEDSKEAQGWIARVLRQDVAGRALEAFEAAKTVGERTAHAALGRVLAEALRREGTLETATRMLEQLPSPQQTASLREVGQWVLETRLAHLPAYADEDRARLLNNLSLYHGTLGHLEAALASTQEAVVLYRRAAEPQPEAVHPGLAASINALSIAQSALGQHEAALTSIQDAVAMCRRLSESRPEEFQPDLALGLTNWGAALIELGRHERALMPTQQAVDLYRQLAESKPEEHLPALARSLNNLGLIQSALGQQDAALDSTQQAVCIRRRLARVRPDAFLLELATSLDNLGNRQSEMGQREAALASTSEAVALLRPFAEVHADVFAPELARSLSNLSLNQSSLGQREAALASAQEAVDLCRKFVKTRPNKFLPELAASLTNLGGRQAELRRHDMAFASTLEAVQILRKLTESRSEAFLPNLAMGLSNLCGAQANLGRLEAALNSVQEAADLYRRLAASRPEAFLPGLARCLYNQALVLANLRRLADAVPVAEGAIDLLWPIYERLPAAHGDLVGAVLRLMAELFKTLSRPADKCFTQRMTRYLTLSGS